MSEQGSGAALAVVRFWEVGGDCEQREVQVTVLPIEPDGTHTGTARLLGETMNAQLLAGFRASIEAYVARLETAQSDLLVLYRDKRVALASADAHSLRALEQPEQLVTNELKSLVEERKQILTRAGQFHLPQESLTAAASAVGASAKIIERLSNCRRRATSLRREGWIHWIVAKRGLAQTSALLDLIVHRGDAPATYDKSVATTGGSLLDASA